MRRFALLVALAFLIPAAAEAQVPRIQFGGGLTAPNGTLNTGLDLGYHVRASIGLSFPLFPVTVRADAEIHQLPETFTTSNYRILAGSVNGMFDIFGLGMLGTGGTLYGVGGLGYYSLDPSLGSATAKVGIQGGLGVTIGALGFGGLVEAKFVNIFTSGSAARYIPITVGIKF